MKLLKRHRILTLCILLILMLGSTGSGEDRKRFVLAFPENPITTDRQLKFIEDLREAFHRLEYEMIMEFYPDARCIILADTGEVDGLPRRVRNLNDIHSNLVRVDVPVYDVIFSAYANEVDLQVDGWESLKGSPFTFLYVNGVQRAKSNLEALFSQDYIYAIDSRESALKMLIAGRGDLLIDMQEHVNSITAQNKVEYREIREVGILEREWHYIFVHKKHRELVPQLERVIREMKSEGRFNLSEE